MQAGHARGCRLPACAELVRGTVPLDVGADVGVTVGRTRRLTLRDAAQVLGISKEAVRKRVKRGTLPSDVGEDGRRYVYLDEAKPGGDARPPRRVPGAVPGPYDPRDELIATLKEQLEAERNAHAETRRITYTLAQRHQLEPPPETRDGPETPTEDVGGAETPARITGEPRRSWWKRFFGFK